MGGRLAFVLGAALAFALGLPANAENLLERNFWLSGPN
jgi:hypothetical protein